MGHWACTKIIDISKDTFEAWRKGKKRIKEFDSISRDETYRDEDFDNCGFCKDIVKPTESLECPNSERVRKRLDAVNCHEVRKDLLYVIRKYKLAEKGWDRSAMNQDGSYVFFLQYYMRQDDFGIPRKYVREEYVDPEEWEFMKDADEYAIVRQNPYMKAEYEDERVKITMWGD